MKLTRRLLSLLLICIFASPVLADHPSKHKKPVELLWLLNGIKNTYECEIPETDQGTTIATCHDHDIINLKTGQIIGTATDATADVVPADTGLVGTGTTFFHLPQGTLVIRGTGSIQPVLHGTPTLDNHPVTHIAGIFPDAPQANNVLYGTGVFKNAEGSFSLLGALDLTHAAQGQSAFHCVYFMDIKVDRKHARRWRTGAPVNPRLD
jgi:hypothetical protein